MEVWDAVNCSFFDIRGCLEFFLFNISFTCNTDTANAILYNLKSTYKRVLRPA